MNEYLKLMINYLHLHPHMGILFTFIIAFLESLPIIGTIVPGSVTMTAIGTLLGTGVLPLGITLLWAILGAFLGDCAGFWIGRRYQHKLLKIWPFNKHPKWITISENFFKKHGGKSIIIGRFAGPVRSTIPLAAGLLQLSWPRFILAAIPAAILWALLYMVPGILLGALSMELPPSKMTAFILTGLGIIFGIWLVFWIIQKSFRHLGYYLNIFIDRCWKWLKRHHSSQFFIRLITNHEHPGDHFQLTLVLLALISFSIFLVLFINVFFKLYLTGFNQPLFLFFQSLRTKSLDTFFILITILGSPLVTTIIGFCVALSLAWKKHWRLCLHLLAAIVITIITVAAIKFLFYSPRPEDFIYFDKSTSFPSGHSAFSMVVYGFIAFVLAEGMSKDFRRIPYAVAALIIMLVMLSRIYLGAHWLSDVLGSFFLGATILFLVIISYRRHPKKHLPLSIPITGLFLLVSLALSWGLANYFLFHKTEKKFIPYSVVFHVNQEQWMDKPLEFLPVYRHNRFGDPIQPFNVQWMANLDEIKKNLLAANWQAIDKVQLVKKTLQRFSSYDPEYHMSLFPWLYLNKPPVLLFIKRLPKEKNIIELRLWATNVYFLNTATPLWIGTVNVHTPPEKLIGLRGGSHISFTQSDVVHLLRKDLNPNFKNKILKIAPNNQPPKIQNLGWDGRILIIYKVK